MAEAGELKRKNEEKKEGEGRQLREGQTTFANSLTLLYSVRFLTHDFFL